MTRTTLNFLLDTLLLVMFLFLVWLAIVLRFVFPPGTAADGWILWGHDFNDWSALEFNLLSIFTFMIFLHVMLHWSWVCGVVSARLSKWRGRAIRLNDGSQTLWGVGLLIVILHMVGLAIAASALTVRPPDL